MTFHPTKSELRRWRAQGVPQHIIEREIFKSTITATFDHLMLGHALSEFFAVVRIVDAYHNGYERGFDWGIRASEWDR